MPRFTKSAFSFGPEFGARLRDKKVARQAAAIAAGVFETWKKTLPPKSDIVA